MKLYISNNKKKCNKKKLDMIIEKMLYISFSHTDGNLVNNVQKCFSRIMYITRCSVVVRHWGYLKKKKKENAPYLFNVSEYLTLKN